MKWYLLKQLLVQLASVQKDRGIATPVQQHSDAILENSHDAITGLHRAMKKITRRKGKFRTIKVHRELKPR